MSQYTPPLHHNRPLPPPDNSPALTGTTTLPSPNLDSPRQVPTPNLLVAGPVQPPVTPITPVSQPKWRVTPQQKEALLAAFEEDAYPELQKKNILSRQLGVTTTQISKWFQHRRESLTRLGQFKAQYNRTRRTPEQLDVLQSAFNADRYPNAEKLAQLEAQLTGVTAKQIKLWFKHRRKQVQKRSRSQTSSPQPSLPIPLPLAKMYHENPLDQKRFQRHEWPAAGILPAPAVPPNMQHPAMISTQHYALHPAYYYKSPPVVMTSTIPFSEMEIMALRGAHAISPNPPLDAIARLAQVLNRPQEALTEWFRSQESTTVNGLVPPFSRSPFLQSTPRQDDPSRTDNNNTVRRDSIVATTPSTFKQTEDNRAAEHDAHKTSNSQDPSAVGSTTGNKPSTESHAQQFEASTPNPGVSPAPKVSAMMKSDVFQTPEMVPQVHQGMYPTYVYPGPTDTSVMIPQQSVQFQAAPPSSVPLLAPLRYADPNTQFVPANPIWYGQAPTFSKG